MDAYDKIYGAMRTAGAQAAAEGAVRLRLGTVLSAFPLKLDVAGTVQEAERVRICHSLTAGSACRASLNGTGLTAGEMSGQASYQKDGLIQNAEVMEGTLSARSMEVEDLTLTRLELGVRTGDMVLLLTDDDQTFYLMDKVVQAI